MSAVLDRLDALEAHYQEDVTGELSVLHARVGWLEATLQDLQSQCKEVQP